MPLTWILVEPNQARAQPHAPQQPLTEGFIWLDLHEDEPDTCRHQLRDAVEQMTGVKIFDLHLQDATNPQHPSYFDGTQHYDMLVFRKLAAGESAPLAELSGSADDRRALQAIVTRPITFFVFDKLLVTVRSGSSRTIDQTQARMLEARGRASSDAVEKARLPSRPAELMLRLLNGMVDRYLDLRQPLTDRLDRWQRELLTPDRPFSNWLAILDARIELRKLENLSEEQYDALQELRDAYLDETPEAHISDGYMVRMNDVMEHIQRVLNHARRLEASAESAVQLHFSATSHRTNQIVRTLTVITAIFAPLSLITGIFGMHFEHMPLLKQADGFWLIAGFMAALAVSMFLVFWVRRVITDRPGRSRLLSWFGGR